MAESVIIVGGGIAGLSAGSYAQMNGYRATVIEMHSIPGGLCTAWTRKGYTWDISMHMLTSSKSSPLNQMWRELGAVQNRQFVYHDASLRVEDGDKSVDFCADVQRLEEQLLALSPDDAERTREFIRLFGGKSIIDMVPLDAPGTAGGLGKLKMLIGMLPLLGTFRKYGRMMLREFADGFQDPFLRSDPVHRGQARLAADVEVVDVPTPATYHRCTGNWQGSPDGWYITPKNMGAPASLTLPDLQGLYMAGQWTATVIAALTGRQVVQLLCKADGKPFRTVTELPSNPE